MAVKLDLNKDLADLAEDIYEKVSPCFQKAQVFSEAERVITDVRDECCGASDTLPCRRAVRTFLNRVDLGRRGFEGHFPKNIADRLSNEVDRLEKAWRKELVAAPRQMLVSGYEAPAPAPEEIHEAEGETVYTKLFGSFRSVPPVPEEVPDCAESDLILSGIQDFLRWEAHLHFAECVCNRGLLR